MPTLRRALSATTLLAAFAIAPSVQAQTSSAPAPATAMLGFSPQGAARQRALEVQFDRQISAADLRAWLQRMSSAPNNVGSPHDRENAEFTAAQFKSWGWDARIETFDILYPTPISQTLELVGPTSYRARLHEPPIAGDRTSNQTMNVLPPYVAYQGDGDVTAELVYVNYGMPADYEQLARQGVDVRGKVVIARYGQGWRGLKPKLAQEHGAVGCIIYSDPADDGYATGDAYPKGGTRPPFSVQRGSVQDMTTYPGDPLTPDVGATKDAKRLTRAQATTLMKIPVLPIGYGDAQPLLAALGGPVAARTARGALPITYHLGPGPARVHLAVRSDWSLKTIYDVIATVSGAERPDEWVIRGNHRDGWVFGAWDPLAGHVAMMAEGKAIGALLKTGWRPKRTLVYASWDAEEPGLVGSTEWVEQHAAELTAKAVIYINSDTNERGTFGAQGSHGFQAFVNEATQDVRDPETGVSIDARARAALQVAAMGPGVSEEFRRQAKQAAATGVQPLGPLGSGSDYSAFVQHLGVPSLNIGFSGEGDQGGVYHSAYDSFDHYVRFGDPKFEYGVALAQTAGRLALRAADADVQPQRFTDAATTIAGYVDELKKLTADMRERTAVRNRLLDAGGYRLAADPTEVSRPPERESVVPVIDMAALDRASTRLTASASAYDAALASASAAGVGPARQASAGAALRGIDTALLEPRGLPGRPWFKKVIYAPGVLTGYGAKTLPGVREALEARRWAEATEYVVITARAIDAYATRIDAARAALVGR